MTCQICDGNQFSYLFVIRGLPFARCRGCGLIALGTLPNSADFRDFYKRIPEEPAAEANFIDSHTEQEAAARYCASLLSRGIRSQGPVLVLAGSHPQPASKHLAAILEQRGFATETLCPCALAQFKPGPRYAAAVALHEVQAHENPVGLLEQIHTLLEPEAPMLLSVPSVDSWPAKFFGPRWPEWKPENRYYFDRETIQLLLLRCGFEHNLALPDRRVYTLEHIYQRASTSRSTALTRVISLAHHLLPPLMRGIRKRLATSGLVVTSVRSEPAAQPKCSIIVPAFNESQSFPVLMDALLKKTIPGVDREILIVESNSTDGTREIVQRYASHPDVKIVLEERPRGKGHAVRTNLAKTTGDIILFQDADLEYDINDYDSLLAPILARRALFVLGSRHGGTWKMRKFSEQEGIAAALNFGHLFFTGLLNLLYRQKMKDPFTMYKVFHRDCLYGLEFECNRFDFDHEIVIKFVRKGYTPLEIPVNYWSRSFREGKKVKIFRDPLTWLRIDFKLRFTRVLHEITQDASRSRPDA
jgi:hypothetical protein